MSLDNPCECGTFSDGYCLNVKSMWDKMPLDEVVIEGKRTYRVKLDAPSDGRFIAYFIDIKYEKVEFPDKLKSGGGGIPYDKPGQLEFTTEVSIWPNTFPYEECSGDTCAGRLL